MRLSGVLLVMTLLIAPQTKAPLEFEVASIKPNATSDMRMMMERSPGGRLNATGFTLRMLMRNAFRIQDFQMVGGPSWMSSDRWDVQAKSEDNATQAQVDEMLQTLLADRFQLRFHKETRELPTYSLVVGKSGPKLQETKADSGTPAVTMAGHGAPVSVGRGGQMVMMGGGKMSLGGGGMTMAQFAQMLGNQLGRNVIDKTGLTGIYDIKLEWTPDPGTGSMPPLGGGGPAPAHPPSDDAPPSVFTAIQEQLGLRIDSTKGSVDVFIIDKAEKPVVEQR